MKKFKDLLSELDFVNTSFLAGTPILALAGTIFLIATDGIYWQTIILTIIMMILTGVGVTAGYHRLFSHRSYDSSKLFKFLMLVFGAAAFENSARKWSSDHRIHHQYVDTDLDPYNIKRGFFYAHMGWVCLKYRNTDTRYENVSDLNSDPLVMWQERYYVGIGIVAGYLIPMAIGSLWGDPWGALILAGFLRMVLNHHFTFFINSFCHMIGTQPYSDENTARDSWIMALFTYGEGYHNFHHKFPSDYRNGIRFFHWDPTKWLIRGLAFIGWTSNLKRVPRHRIVMARLVMDEKRLIKKIQTSGPAHQSISHEFVVNARVKFEEAYLHFQKLKTDYRRMKEERIAAFNVQMHNLNDQLDVRKREILKARENLLQAMTAWRELCRMHGVTPIPAVI